MAKKLSGSRRENRVAIYLPPEIRAALEAERIKKPVPETMSTFIVNALVEWLEQKEIVWRRKGEEKSKT
jgi:hypothetical protein